MLPAIRHFDTYMTSIIAGWSVSLKPFFLAITMLGDPVVTIGIGIAVATWGGFRSNVRMMISGGIVCATLVVGALLKIGFGRARPLTDYAANLRIDTFSFPSGHTSGATIAYGLLAYLAWHMLPQPWGYAVAVILIALIILVGISRVYLGAHFPSDVVAGWLLGSLALLIIIFIVRPL